MSNIYISFYVVVSSVVVLAKVADLARFPGGGSVILTVAYR